MARHLHLDPLGGMAGDMFLAALLDAYPELTPSALGAMRTAGLPETWEVRLVAHDDGTLIGHRLIVEGPDGDGPPAHFATIRAGLREAPLEPGVRTRAIAILTELARAEGEVHGVPIDHVHFHELSDWDSIADVVGAAAVIEALGSVTWSVAPLPLGSGRVMTRHGPLPVPAPATALLLEGFPVHDDGVAGERVTPTGAAILRHLDPTPRLPAGAWQLRATGHGFGSRRMAGISNVLRVVAYAADDAGRCDDRVAVLTFEVDDQSPEELAVGLDALRASDGVLDVVQMPAFGKKGRLGAHIQILARPDSLDAVIDRCFAETTTLGLRWRVEARAVLAREVVAAQGVEVKVVSRPDGARTAKAEIDQVSGAGHAARTEARRSAEAQALQIEAGVADRERA